MLSRDVDPRQIQFDRALGAVCLHTIVRSLFAACHTHVIHSVITYWSASASPRNSKPFGGVSAPTAVKLRALDKMMYLEIAQIEGGRKNPDPPPSTYRLPAITDLYQFI